MQILRDLILSLNFNNIGKTLSKRPVGLVAGSLAILVVIYVAIIGAWYVAIGNEFIDAALEIAKPDLPSFNIINGQLTMNSPEPYIKTHEDMYRIISEAVMEVDRKQFGGRYFQDIITGLESGQRTKKESFCLVMDTTDSYRDQIDPADYSRYAVVTKDSMELVDRIQTMPGNIVPIKERMPQAIIFTPDRVDDLKAPIKRFATIAIFVGLMIYAPIYFLIKALIGASIAWLLLLTIKKQKPFYILYKISLYALVPFVFLIIIQRFGLPIPGLIYQVVYFAYIFMAVKAVLKAEVAPSQNY